MRTRMYGGVRGRKTKIGGKPTFVFLLLDFFVVTQSFGLFSLRRVLVECSVVWFRAATQSFLPFSLRRVHC